MFEIVQVQASVLPTGAATEATLAALAATVDGVLVGGTQTTRITDGTNTATVKAASAAAVASDKAIVVAVSPNNTIPVSGPLTDAQLRASAVPVSVSGASTEATLAAASAKLPASLGAKPAAASFSVTLATDEATLSVDATPLPDPTIGASQLFYRASTASTNATLIKGSSANVNSIVVANVRNSNVFLKLYNKATAPNVGTDTPSMTIVIPANLTLSVPCGPFGIRFPLGLGMGLTTGIPVNSTGAVAVDDAHVSISYT